MSPFGPTRAQNMFGGVGIYCDDHFFAMGIAGQIFLKVDDENRGAFEAAGAQPFIWIRPTDGKPVPMGYWSMPAEATDPASRSAWGEMGLAAARRARARRPAKKKTGRSPKL